jgi:hypothetical protein
MVHIDVIGYVTAGHYYPAMHPGTIVLTAPSAATHATVKRRDL